MNKIRDFLVKDPAAMRCWHLVVDELVWTPAENQRVKELLKEGKHEHAVLETLAIFDGAGDGDMRAELIAVLKEQGLDKLAEDLRQHCENEGWLQWDIPDPDPRRLRKLVLCLAPKISVTMLAKLCCVGPGGSHEGGEVNSDLKRSIAILQAAGMLSVEGDVVTVLLSANRFATSEEEVDIIEGVRNGLEKELIVAPQGLRQECITHAMALLPHLLRYDELVRNSWKFLLHVAVQIQTLGDHSTLLSFTEQATPKLAAVFSEKHEHTLEMKRRVGEARLMWSSSELSAGRLESGREHFGHAVAVLEPVLFTAVAELGESHLITLLARDSLARAYNGTAQYDKALPLAEENVRFSTAGTVLAASSSSVRGSEMTILFMLTKGIVLFTMGRFSYAIPVLDFVVREGSTKPGVASGAISVAQELLTLAMEATGKSKTGDPNELKKATQPLPRK